MRIIIAILILCWISSCAPPKIIRAPFLLTDVNSNGEQKEFKRILIVATGSSGARLFLDRLTNVLNSKFASENVTTSYEYLGYVPDEKIEIDKRF